MRQKISPTAITSNEQMIYYLLTEEDAVKEMTKTIRDVNDILGLPSTALVRLILNYFRWDSNTLTERYYEDPDKLFETLRVANPNLSPSLQWDPNSPACGPIPNAMIALGNNNNSNTITCRTCCADKSASEVYALPCRHQHCIDCWQGYLESNIVNNGGTQTIYCISRCTQILDDEQILKLLVNNENIRQRYQRLLIDTFVNTNRLTQWCPGNGCSTIIKMKNYSRNCAQLVECDSCKTISCFQCSRPWHAPIQCSLLEKWEQKNRDESMTGTWIIANTKECPNCHTSIEKNGGCNHMTCRKPGCNHEFCWICFGDWRAHATQQCNVYRQEETEKEQSEARENLARYIHYFTRFQTHNQSLEFEGKLIDQVEQRRQEMQAKGMSYTEQQSVLKAFETLKQCRRTLKYTYPFAFYLKRDHQSEIFEQNQADLEQATEHLSGFLENEIAAEQKIAQKLMDLTSYCDQRREKLLDHCRHGYKDRYWEGLDPY